MRGCGQMTGLSLFRRMVLAGLCTLTWAVPQVGRSDENVLNRAIAQVRATPTLRAPRFDLARALLDAGRLREARGQFKLLLDSSRDAQDTRLMLLGLDAVDRAAPKWSFAVSGGLLPSSNLNAAARGKTLVLPNGRVLTITDGGQPQTGVGYTLTGHAQHMSVVGLGQRLLASAAVTRTQYPTYHQSSFWALRPALAYRIERPRATYELELSARRAVYDRGDRHRTQRGLRANGRWLLTARLGAELEFAREWLRYDMRDYLDGTQTTARAGLTWQAAPNWVLTLGAQRQERQTRLIHNGYDLNRVSAGAQWRLTPQDRLDGSISFGRQMHAAPVPGIGVTRVDHQRAVTLGWQTSRVQLWGAAPRLSCTWSETRSNIALYETQSTDCALSLSRNF